MKSVLFIVLSFFVFIPCYSQNGSISGKIIEAKSGTPLPGATVLIEGTTQGAMSDLDGNFKIMKVAPGKFAVRVSYIGYISELFENVEFRSGEDYKIEVRLRENINQLQGTEIVAQRTTHTDNAV